MKVSSLLVLALVCALVSPIAIAAVPTTTVRAVQVSCPGVAGEIWNVFVDLASQDILRAVDTMLETSADTVIEGWGQGSPTDACAPASFVTFNAPVGQVDCTMLTPDFNGTGTNVRGGHFCNDPTSTQKDPINGSVLVAHLLIRSTSTTTCGPQVNGVINAIVDGVRQFPVQICIGSGCSPCGVAGSVVPIVRPNEPTTYQFVSGSPPVAEPLLLNAISENARPRTAVSANVVFGPDVGGVRSAAKLVGSTPLPLSPPGALRVVFVSLSSVSCPSNTSLRFTVESRTWGVAQSMSVYGFQVQAQYVTLSPSVLGSSTLSCSAAMQNVATSLATSNITYDRMVVVLPGTTTSCGLSSGTAGCVAPRCFVAVSSCDSVERIVHHLLLNNGLAPSLGPSGSDLTCMTGIPRDFPGVHRRGLSGGQQLILGHASVSVAAGAAGSALLPALYTTGATILRVEVPAQGTVVASFRAASHPGIDRHVNASEAAAGRVSLHQVGDGRRVELVAILRKGESFIVLGQNFSVTDIVADIAVVIVNGGTPPPSPIVEIPPSGSFSLDAAAFAEMANGGDGPNNTAYSTSSDLDLGVNGADIAPFAFAQFKSVPLSKLQLVDQALLILSANVRQRLNTGGTLYLEVASELLDNANHALIGNVLSTEWSSLRSLRVLNKELWEQDEEAFDVTQLVQQLVDRSGWLPYNAIFFRLRNDPKAPFAIQPPFRTFSSGLGCPYPFRCGPRLAINFSSRPQSNRTYTPSGQIPATEPLNAVQFANDGLNHTLVETPRLTKFYQFHVGNFLQATLTIRARVQGPESFRTSVQLGANFQPIQALGFTDTGDFEQKSASVFPISVRDNVLTVQISDASDGAVPAASTIIIDYIGLQVRQVDVPCIMDANPTVFGRCNCVTSLACGTRLVVSPAQGGGTACPNSTVCQACVPQPCAPVSTEVTVNTFISSDGRQQWSGDYSIVRPIAFPTPSGNVSVGVIGQAVSTPGPFYFAGYFQLSADLVPPNGTAVCRVVEVELRCNTGDARALIQGGGSVGPLECVNARVPDARATSARFVVECRP